MIGSLTGVVEEMGGNNVLLNVEGVGYEVHCSLECLATLTPGKSAKIIIYTEVKQESLRLYGFLDKLEKQTFMMLLAVKGVGARSAADVISRINKRDLLRIIGAGDIAQLQALRGIGKKTAERIIVELKDKVGEFVEEQQGGRKEVGSRSVSPQEEAVQALQALGFGRKEAEAAIAEVERQAGVRELDAGAIVKLALRYV